MFDIASNTFGGYEKCCFYIVRNGKHIFPLQRIIDDDVLQTLTFVTHADMINCNITKISALIISYNIQSESLLVFTLFPSPISWAYRPFLSDMS